MKIIISPAKKMNVDTDGVASNSIPVYFEQAGVLRNYLRDLKFSELKSLLSCNDKIAKLNFNRLQNMDLVDGLTPALLAYEGIQYQYMAPHVFTDTQWDYVEENLRILSGFYGILKPLDGIVPYRLEMQAKLKSDFCKNLYNFWGDKLYKDLVHNDDFILNLASKEYSKTIEPYLDEKVTLISCTFGTMVNGKIKVKATEAKMARGEMVRYLAENNITEINKIKGFQSLNFQYSEEFSTDSELVFLKYVEK
ncbi:peroxide stress protein YaaA [Metaclostridioides mangenotii]|uniref:peroxide stress protein YaaA n=1 Tax=Metaclostridioides mangenotii TaxID=1540 RepID=UPI0028E357BA|nr:peroxide stress protein YaaA [Clostridioides mangenotii]